MITLTFNIDETKWQYALDKANATVSARNDTANAQGVSAAAAATVDALPNP